MSTAFELSSRVVDALAELSPIMATFLGLPGPGGRRDEAFDDLSPSGLAARERLWRETEAEAAALTPTSRADALCLRVLADYAEAERAALASGDALADLNSIASPVQTLIMALDLATLGTPEGRSALTKRLSALEGALLGYRETLEAGRAAGKMAARRQVEAVIGQCRAQAAEGSFLTGLVERAGAPEGEHPATEAERGGLADAAVQARAAFGALADHLERNYLPSAPQADGVGAERYARAVRQHLGMRLSDDGLRELYAWAFDEIRRLESEMRTLAGRILPGATVAETIAHLKTSPAHCAPTTEAFLDVVRDRQTRALAQLAGVHFDVSAPVRDVLVRRAPPGGGPIGAYYMPPAEDFSRPGTICYQFEAETDLPLWDEITTAYHEGFPGHHLHFAGMVVQAAELSRFQRLVGHNTGHAEGWALYAEQLMCELGFLERPEYELGMLAAQLLRSWRVAVDVGAHLGLSLPAGGDFHPGAPWTFDRAVEAMSERAFLSPAYAASEVTRYFGWPAQAIAYKVGQRVILDLRDSLRRDPTPLGGAFDLRAFHARILGVGAVGLDLLRELTLAPT